MLYRIIIHLNQLCSPLGSFVRLKAITFRLDPHKHQKEKLAVSNICIILVLFQFCSHSLLLFQFIHKKTHKQLFCVFFLEY